MRTIIIILATLVVASCANSGVQSIGKDTYMVSARVPFSGQTGAKTEALNSAASHCASLGKKMMMNAIDSSECALRGGCGEAQVVYSCLDSNDPRYQTPNM